MNKAIYMPKGKAGEYAKYACNLYVGCNNNCTYCYCKKGILGHAMGQSTATLKKCFIDEDDAYDIFREEIHANYKELEKHGLFFTFSSDPMLKSTRDLTIRCVSYALAFDIPCMILTKRADFIQVLPQEWFINPGFTKKIAFGFTLTGHDELEPGADYNSERIKAMKYLSCCGFKTFASIEPVIDLNDSYNMIEQTLGFCDHYKIGLLSYKKDYTPNEVMEFMRHVHQLMEYHDATLYWKDSVWNYIKADKKAFFHLIKIFNMMKYCIDYDYNMFNDETTSL